MSTAKLLFRPHLLVSVVFAALACTLQAQNSAPATIANQVFSFTITSATPPFATSGSYRILFTSTGTFNLLDGSGGIASSQHGTYTYSRTGPATATVNYHFLSPANFPDASGNEPTTLNFNTASSGTYIGIGGGGSNTGTFTFASGAPVFTAQPQAQSITAGARVTFTAVVASPLTTTYQWQKDSVPVAGATASTLTLPAATGAHAGAYRLIATNAAGSATSSTAQLTVTGGPEYTPASIVNQEFNFTIATATAPFANTGSYKVRYSPDGTFTITGISSNIAPNQRGTFVYTRTSNSTATLLHRFTNPTNFPDASGNSYATLTFTSASGGRYSGTGGGGTNAGTFTLGTSDIPVFIAEPVAQFVAPGAYTTLWAEAVYTTATTFQWYKDGAPILGATQERLPLPSVTAANAGNYTLVATNASGSTTSAPGVITVDRNADIAPAALANFVLTFRITSASAPFATSGSYRMMFNGAGGFILFEQSGSAVSNYYGTYTFARTGPSAATLRCRFVSPANFPDASGETTTTLTFTAAGVGSYTVAGGGTQRGTFTLDSSRIGNLSIRSAAGTGDQTLIAGFAVSGGLKTLLVRGVGPTLAKFNVSGPLADPRLTVYSGTSVAASNDNWGTASNAAGIGTASAANGAFELPSGSRDAALLSLVNEASFTAQVGGTGSGIALVEIYDADGAGATARLVNVSARTQVGTGDDILIAGFVIQGNAPKTVLIRGIGPALVPLGVAGALSDPQLSLYAGTSLISSNDDWSDSTNASSIATAASRVGAFPLTSGSLDAALLVTVPPGSYTAQLSGFMDSTGVAIVEIYEVP